MKNDDFGDRMKRYEHECRFKIEDKRVYTQLDHFDLYEIEERGYPFYPYVRIDGRSFSRFTKKLASRGLIKKPRDTKFENVFVLSVKDTVEEFNLKLGFHQSDEISLFFAPVLDDESQMVFDGNLSKLLSVVPSYFTSRFCYHFNEVYAEVPECSFDGRMCIFQSDAEATNMLVWRYQDASRNLIQDIAHHQFSDKQLFKVSTQQKFEMIGSPDLKPGNFIKRVKYKFDTPFVDKFKMQETVIRSRTDLLDIDFSKMNFEERVNLIYGELNV